MIDVSFRLYGNEGYVNPTPWPTAGEHKKFDGGWRWMDSIFFDGMVIYNMLLHPRASTRITAIELVDPPIDPEFTLLCAKYRTLVEHAYFTAREDVLYALFENLAYTGRPPPWSPHATAVHSS